MVRLSGFSVSVIKKRENAMCYNQRPPFDAGFSGRSETFEDKGLKHYLLRV